MKKTFTKYVIPILVFVSCLSISRQSTAHQTAKLMRSSTGNITDVKTAPVLDTVPCMFYALMSDKHTALAWKRGHIVLEDKKIVIGQGAFSYTEAVAMTGVIHNTFLSPDKKKTFKKQVIKVVLL